MGAFASPAAAPGGPHGQSQACKLWPAAIGLGQRLFSWTRPSGIPVMKYFESFCHVLPLRARGDRPETKIHTFAASPDQIPPVTNHRRSTEASLLCQENTLYWVNFQGNLALHGIEAVKVRNTIQEIFLVEKSAERGVPLGKGGGSFRAGTQGGILLPVGQGLPLEPGSWLQRLHVLPAGNDFPVSDLLLDGTDLGAELGGRGAGHT